MLGFYQDFDSFEEVMKSVLSVDRRSHHFHQQRTLKMKRCLLRGFKVIYSYKNVLTLPFSKYKAQLPPQSHWHEESSFLSIVGSFYPIIRAIKCSVKILIVQHVFWWIGTCFQELFFGFLQLKGNVFLRKLTSLWLCCQNRIWCLQIC